VCLEREMVWLSLNQMAKLFGRDKSVISRHLRNVFVSKELDREALLQEMQQFKRRVVVRSFGRSNTSTWTLSSPSAWAV